MAGNINTHSPVYTQYCYRKQNAVILEKLIETFSLLFNNEPRHAICLSCQTISKIDLAFSIAKLDSLIL